MRARFVVRRHPTIEIILQLVDGSIDFLAERHAIELIEHGSMEVLADSVGLRALGFGSRMINVRIVQYRAFRRTVAPDRSKSPPR